MMVGSKDIVSIYHNAQNISNCTMARPSSMYDEEDYLHEKRDAVED